MTLLAQLALIFGLAFYFYYQSSELKGASVDSKIENTDERSDLVGQMMTDVTLTEFKAEDFGKKDWRLKAKKAASDNKEVLWNVKKSEVTLFKENKEAVKIFSDKGLINTDTKNLNLTGNVRSQMESGYLLLSKNLSYLSAEERFFSKDEVYVEGPQKSTVLKGSSFEGDMKLGTVSIMGPIYCEQEVPDYDKAVIKSATAEVNIENRFVSFKNNLFIKIGEMTITGREAEFKYSKVTGELQALIIKGKVFASQEDKSASADLLEIRVKEGVFLFQGKPRFVSEGNTLVGDEILLYNKAKNVQILNGKVKTESDIKLIEGQ